MDDPRDDRQDGRQHDRPDGRPDAPRDAWSDDRQDDRPVVHCPDPSDEYFFVEGCFILETWNRPSDPAVSIARARVAPGVATRRHCLAGIVERYLILEGQGEVEVGAMPWTPVGPGDLVSIPPGQSQRIANRGAGDLIFLAICTPRFVPERYQDLEPDARSDDDRNDAPESNQEMVVPRFVGWAERSDAHRRRDQTSVIRPIGGRPSRK